MPYDIHGRKINGRGRQICVNQKDMEVFSELLKEAFPNVRFVHPEVLPQLPEYAERFRDLPSLGETGKSTYIILDSPDWKPETVYREKDEIYYVINKPQPILWCLGSWDIRKAEFDIPGTDITVTGWSDGHIMSNNFVEDREARRKLDKVYRLTRKFMSNRVVLVDMITGEVLKEEKDPYNWHGLDLARQCWEAPNTYLQFSIHRDKGLYHGWKSAEGL